MRFFLFLGGLFLFGAAGAYASEGLPATLYFPVLPMDAPDASLPQLVPLAANHRFDQDLSGMTRAIIVIHDEKRDAAEAQGLVATLAGSQNATTLILAPQFLLPSDLDRFADFLPDRGKDFASWKVLGWSFGDDSVPTKNRKSISSFMVVDLLAMFLSDREHFPNMTDIVVAGAGVGANFVQRYAAFTKVPEVLEKQNMGVRFLVAGATSYLYLTAARPLGGSKGFGLPDAKACPAVQTYPYGLEKLNDYARRAGVNEAKIAYGARAITYVNAHAPDVLPDGSCAAAAQGRNGIVRVANYKLYLQTLYGELVKKTQTFGEGKGSNSAEALLGSACGMATLFGNGVCEPMEGAGE